MNKKFGSNIKRWWYLYLITLFVLPLGFYYLSYSVNYPKNEEIITLFFASCKTDYSKVSEKLNENKPSYLRKIEINSYLYDDERLKGIYLPAFGASSDIVLLPEIVIDDSFIVSNFIPLKDISDLTFEKESSYCPSFDQQPYGQIIHKKGDSSGDYFSFFDSEHEDMNYYLFFNRNSIHLKKEWNTICLFSSILEECR